MCKYFSFLFFFSLIERKPIKALSLLIVLSIGRGSVKGLLQATERLYFSHAPPLVPLALSAVRSLADYRTHFELAAPTDAALLGIWKYHSVAPQSKRKGYSSSSNAACASDGSFLYIINKEGLLKIGTGFGGTVSGCVRISLSPPYTMTMH